MYVMEVARFNEICILCDWTDIYIYIFDKPILGDLINFDLSFI